MDVNLTIADPRITTLVEQVELLHNKLNQLLQQGTADMARDQEALGLIQQLNERSNQMAEMEAQEAAKLVEVRNILEELRRQGEGSITAEGTTNVLDRLNLALQRQNEAIAISTANQASLEAMGNNPDEPLPEPVQPTP
jgi:hypothetical protein